MSISYQFVFELEMHKLLVSKLMCGSDFVWFWSCDPGHSLYDFRHSVVLHPQFFFLLNFQKVVSSFSTV
jgi:hypothetical protein